ncbi:efflux RND transporter permease subunit [bacterium]|nr:MAG: efflux RND transporter permease subunit [bacterium]
MNLTRTAIARPIFILMLIFAALLGGFISYRSMRVEQNPEVSFGTITVVTTYPGASPDDINELVTRPVEQAVSGVNGIRDITSTSQEGSSVVVVQFELGIDENVALNDVRTKVDAILNELPTDVEKPTVAKQDTTSTPVLYLAVASKTMNSRDLRTLLDDKIADRFAQINGVASATVQGGDIREIQVQLQRERLIQYGLGITEVRNAVAGASINAPAGRLVDGPTEYTVRVNAQYTSAAEIANTVLSINDPNNPTAKARTVRLGDIAKVVDTIEERTSYARLNGKDSIIIAIQKTREGNAVEITKAADAEVAAIQKAYPDAGLSFVKTLEQAKIITESLDDLIFTIIFGIILVAVTVYVFLHDLRGTAIVALAIPSCIFITFIALKLMGFTINNMSMLALSLAVGVLVDDAIVVLENIYRHLKLGEDPREAALNGRGEIGLAALAITFADVVVFLPIAFMGGIVGQFFKPLALGYVAAVLASLFISFTLTPLLAARWYKAGEDIEHPKGRFARGFERGFGRLEGVYRRALEWSLNHRWFVFAAGNSVLLGIVAFLMGSGVPAKPALGEKNPDLSKIGIPGAIQAGMPILMLALFVGFIVFVVNHLRAQGNSKKGWLQYLAALIVAVVLSKLMPPPMGAMLGKPPMLLIFAFVVFGLGLLIKNAVRPISRSRYLLAGLTFGLVFPLFAVGGYGYAQWKAGPVFKFGFLPETDPSSVNATIELPPGTSLSQTQKVVNEIEGVFMKHPDVKYTMSNVGTQASGAGGASNNGSNYAIVMATLLDRVSFSDNIFFWKKHDEKLRTKSGDSIAAELTRAVGRVAGAKVNVSAAGGFAFGSPIQVSLTGDDRELLTSTAVRIRNWLASGKVAGVINPDISSKPGKLELRAEPDRVALADRGVTVSDFAGAVRTLYQGDDNTKLRSGGREYAVRVMMDLEDRNDPDLLRTVPVSFKQGEPIYLGSVAKINQAPGYSKITRNQRSEQISVTADILPGYANGSVVQQVFQGIEKEKLIPDGVKTRALGEADAQAREMGFLFSAMGLGIVLVYMLLASLYDNLLYPLIIQIAQPQAFIGALFAIVLTDKSLNLVAFIGIITLVGLVAKNAILLVDYTNTLRDRGRNRHDALVEAGPTRLRPIMMTTIALILGMLPVALALGRGSEFRETIGITIIGGMTLSTFLTLLVIPCSYTIFDDMSNSFGRWSKRGFGLRRVRS